MHEGTHERHGGFAALQELLGELARALADAVLELAAAWPLAGRLGDDAEIPALRSA
jgi:hypothetical protein